MVPTDEHSGGSLGEVRASDQDPHDTLHYNILHDQHKRLTQAFKVDLETGRLFSSMSVPEGHYSMNISVSDGKFTTFSPANIEVININDDMIANGMIIVLGGANPEEFILSYRRSFLRSVKSIMNVRNDDVIILSIEPTTGKATVLEPTGTRYRDEIESFALDISHSIDISLLFCVRKSNGHYFSRKQLFHKIASEVSLMESTMGLRVLRLESNMCHNITCSNGECEDVIDLQNSPVVLTTEAMNFVSMKHTHEGICLCPTGYAGKLCDKVLNECAYSPCPEYKECIPNDSERGYSCNCPEGLVGTTCSKKVAQCLGYQNTPSCYSPNNPVSFHGKAFTQYNIRTDIETKFTFTTWFRTSQLSGNLMFLSGRIDYSILDVSFSMQYRVKIKLIYEINFISAIPVRNS